MPQEPESGTDGRKGILGQGQFGVPFRLNPVYIGPAPETHQREA